MPHYQQLHIAPFFTVNSHQSATATAAAALAECFLFLLFLGREFWFENRQFRNNVCLLGQETVQILFMISLSSG